jgi:DNA-binding NarL/FixJ family response regulator
MGAYRGTILAVLELYKEGHTVDYIAARLGMEPREVSDIIANYS